MKGILFLLIVGTISWYIAYCFVTIGLSQPGVGPISRSEFHICTGCIAAAITMAASVLFVVFAG